jgi:hypothetical protein
MACRRWMRDRNRRAFQLAFAQVLGEFRQHYRGACDTHFKQLVDECCKEQPESAQNIRCLLEQIEQGSTLPASELKVAASLIVSGVTPEFSA